VNIRSFFASHNRLSSARGGISSKDFFARQSARTILVENFSYLMSFSLILARFPNSEYDFTNV
jgi:hypothetical protein